MTLKRSLPLLITLMLLGDMFELPWLITFSVAVSALLLIAKLWQHRSLDQVEYKRRWHYRRGFPGEKTSVRIIAENKKILPLSWLKVTDNWPSPVGLVDNDSTPTKRLIAKGQLINLYSLRWHQRITRKFEIMFRKRGVYTVGPAQLESGDLFGLFETKKKLEKKETLTVFPEILPLETLQLPTDDPFGDRKAQRKLFEDPNLPMGVRPYQPEDDFRRVHWGATARTGALQVKLCQPVTSKVMVVCLNVTTSKRPWLGTSTELLEQLIKVSATMVYHSSEDGYAVGLVSNGCLTHANHPFMVPPGRSPAQLGKLLESLASVTPYTSAPFEDYLIRSLPQMAYGATLTVVTAFVTPTLSETLLRLKRYRTNTTLISLEETPPPDLPGIRTIHLPFIYESDQNRYD